MFGTLLMTMARLTVLAGAGFLVFRPRWSQQHVYPRFIYLTLNVMLPIYFVQRIPNGWASTRVLGPYVIVGFFVLCLVMMALQAGIGIITVRRAPRAVTMRTQFVLLATLHNAGFLPIPILERIVPESILIATFFYLFAFNLVFWSIAAPIIHQGQFSLRSFRFRLSPSLASMIAGFVLAATGWYRFVPESVDRMAGIVGSIALDMILIALGGALAGIHERLRIERQQILFVGVRMFAYPAAMLAVAAIPWPGLSEPAFSWGIRAFLVLEATVPPATQTMVVTRSVGNEAAVHYVGRMILITYLVSLVTIPFFMGIANLLFAS